MKKRMPFISDCGRGSTMRAMRFEIRYVSPEFGGEWSLSFPYRPGILAEGRLALARAPAAGAGSVKEARVDIIKE